MPVITVRNDVDIDIDSKPGDSVWVGIGKFSVWIRHVDGSLIIEGFPGGDEMCGELGQLQLWEDDIPGDD